LNRLKTIKYINETPVDEMISQIKTKGNDKSKVIESAKASRTEYGLKVQELIERLESQ